MCSFITEFEKRFYVNKRRLRFYSCNLPRVALRKDVCVLFTILISKSVFSGNFRYATGVFYSEIRRTSYSRSGKSCFCELLCSRNVDGRIILFLRVSKIEK